MIEIFWGCLIGGIAFALISLLGGHGLHHGVHGIRHSPRLHGAQWLNPMTIVGAITAFGGAGILLARYTALEGTPVLIAAIAIGLLISVALHFAVVRPMSNSEASIGFSMSEYVGKPGLVTIPIPESGFGQVMISMGHGRSVQVAASFDHCDIPLGSRIVVVEVDGHALRVARVESLE
jgi:membrane protein implicated in regulation of membrane protease activity